MNFHLLLHLNKCSPKQTQIRKKSKILYFTWKDVKRAGSILRKSYNLRLKSTKLKSYLVVTHI